MTPVRLAAMLERTLAVDLFELVSEARIHVAACVGDALRPDEIFL